MTFPMPHSTVVTRGGAVTDAEGRPSAPATVATFLGLAQDLTAAERPQGDTLGEETTAQELAPLGTDIRAQDGVAITFDSGTTRSYRVVSVADVVDVLLVDLRRDG